MQLRDDGLLPGGVPRARRRAGPYGFYGVLAPLMGPIFLGVALGVWRLTLRHYQGAGS